MPGRATVYRMLVRNNLINPVRRRRRREGFIAWERPAHTFLVDLQPKLRCTHCQNREGNTLSVRAMERN